jgi:hypothetical protein
MNAYQLITNYALYSMCIFVLLDLALAKHLGMSIGSSLLYAKLVMVIAIAVIGLTRFVQGLAAMVHDDSGWKILIAIGAGCAILAYVVFCLGVIS